MSLSSNRNPTLFLIGDSTVKAGSGNGGNGMWGWGSMIPYFFDSTKINIENHAIGGRSSRTFLSEGRWEPVLSNMEQGDFLIIQFGHNDDWAINDTIRARGSITGIGDESVEIENMITQKHEVVHSYGWYLKKYAREAKAKGVEVYICSQVPMNRYTEEGLLKPLPKNYPQWAKQVAGQTKSYFIDLQNEVGMQYQNLGYDHVKEAFFTQRDDVHTNKVGAILNAKTVANLIEEGDGELKKYLKK
ncbi:rhamnogalacturonan acetylesterase [Jiulongibacter sp. NS-SX5]|uniref:rhamnogalacturonan acetylesterase n=1 Tax=Jiulongibacter sp. NS-SX5 TaxID=3463854 RepID=UPI00405A1094